MFLEPDRLLGTTQQNGNKPLVHCPAHPGLAGVLDGVAGGRGDARFGVDEVGNVFIVTKQSGIIYGTGLVLSGYATIPEPTSIGLLMAGSALLIRRRRV